MLPEEILPSTLATLMSRPLSHPKGILLLSSGSKVAIAQIAKAAASKRGLALHGSDLRENVPTRHFVDQFSVFDPKDRSCWIESLIQYCNKHSIALVIPTRHEDLEALAAAASDFDKAGIGLSLSSKETIGLCIDKLNTYQFLSSIDVPTPLTVSRPELDASPLAKTLPLFGKPARGSGSHGGASVRSGEDLETIPQDWILQSHATGREFTINLYLDRSGRILCAIPHERLITESGEVVQAETKRIGCLIESCRKVAQALPGAQGILNIQAFYDEPREYHEVIELNPRIGGGYPLADQAKGTYIEWLCQEWIDGVNPPSFDKWTEHLRMMRYRDAVFEL